MICQLWKVKTIRLTLTYSIRISLIRLLILSSDSLTRKLLFAYALMNGVCLCVTILAHVKLSARFCIEIRRMKKKHKRNRTYSHLSMRQRRRHFFILIANIECDHVWNGVSIMISRHNDSYSEYLYRYQRNLNFLIN